MNGYQITHFTGTDGVPVIQIDTAFPGLDMIRVNLNDAVLYNGRPDKDEAPGISLIPSAPEGDERECERCGDEVQYLSSRDWCDGCEERDTKPKCDECDTREGDGDYLGHPIELNCWPNLKEPVTLCPSCTHNARRSGWEPGQ